MAVDRSHVEAAARAQAASELLRQRLQQLVVVATPAAGAEWVQQVPAGAAWELLSAQYTLTTSAAVANRATTLQFLSPDSVRYGRINPNAAQAAGVAAAYSYLAGLGMNQVTAPASVGLPSPPIVLPSGHYVGSLTAGLDVGDQYAGVVLTVRQWSMVDCSVAADWLADHWRR